MAAPQRASRSTLEMSDAVSDALPGAQPRSDAARADAAANGFWLTLALVAICQLMDLVTFNVAVERFGPSGELGPLGIVYRFGGFWAVAAVKLGLIGVVVTVLAKYPWQRTSTRRRVALIVAAIGLFGAVTNVLAFFWLT